MPVEFSCAPHPGVINLNSNIMETKALIARHWVDLVFENRNKEYGAYLLRRSYDNRLLVGLFGTLLVATLLLFIPRLLPHTIPDVIIPEDFGPVIKLIEPPVLPRRRPETPRRPAVQHIVPHNTIPVITTDIVEDLPVTDEPVTFSNDGSETGTVNDADITGVTTGVVEEPIVDDPNRVLPGAEIMPRYQGGERALMEFLQKKLRYPSAPRRLGIDGTVHVSFVVNGDGTIRDVAILKGIHPDLDAEAMRVVSMLPGWIGGKQGGRPVAVRMVLPIKFKLG